MYIVEVPIRTERVHMCDCKLLNSRYYYSTSGLYCKCKISLIILSLLSPVLSLRIIFLTSHLSIFKVLYSQLKSPLEHLSQPSDHRSLQLIEDNIIRFFRKLGIFRPYQRHTDFCMRSIRKHIDRLYFLNLVSPECQGGQVSGLGLRVAGYVNDPGGCQFYKRI